MRWADMDAQGHINNSAFLVYLEQARIDLFFHRATARGLTSIAGGVVVSRHEIDYRRPVVYAPEPLDIDIWCSSVRGAAFTVDYEIRADGELVVLARSVCVPFDLGGSRPRRLTDDERGFLAELGGDEPT